MGLKSWKGSQCSPDLNPIENAWAKLKECIYKKAIEGSWEDLENGYFVKLISFTDSRVSALLEAKSILQILALILNRK
jgi:transposase